MKPASAPEIPRIEPTGFFVLRSPALAFDEVERWSEGLEAPASGGDGRLEEALENDRRRLRRRLAEVAARPEVREALGVASPGLVRALDGWRAKPDSKKGRRAEAALVRYFLRMATRPTPFGLFAGWALGEVGTRTRLGLGDRSGYRRHARLDMNYLSQLARELEHSDGLRDQLRYHPNSSLYRAAGRYRFSEARIADGVRSYHLVAVEASDYLEAVLERARGGATGEELAQALVDWDPEGEITHEEAAAFIADLARVGLLESELTPSVTGREPIHALIAELRRHPPMLPVAERLESVRAACERLEDCPPEAGAELYRQTARSLAELPIEIQPGRLFQIDMTKHGGHASVGPEVVREIERGIDLLVRLSAEPYDALAEFRRKFLARYESDQDVPLVEALDEETGVGFPREGELGSEGSPLLAGLAFPPAPEGATTVSPHGAALRARLLERALREGTTEVEIDPARVPAAAEESGARLPDAFQVMATLAGSREDGDFRLVLHNVYGPSGARLLGRFCHTDERLREAVRAHLLREEELDPDAVFAEVVHLPEGRMGNILCRPVLRRHEIPFLGRSGAPDEGRIPVDDLTVSVSGSEVILRSASLGRRVLPRLSSAHNFTRRSLGIYRFLCTLQSQGVRETLIWSWGALEGSPFLPRVTCGRLVLSRASWRLFEDEIERLTGAEGAELFRVAQELRRARRLPRRVLMAESDHELLVDLDNVLSIEAFVALIKNRFQVPLMELYPEPGDLPARGGDGRYTHEMVIPFARRREPTRRRAHRPSATVRRRFPPGSEWSYLKLYTGTATADRVLRESIGPLLREARRAGEIDRWFFIRYGDPEWHLRLRMHGEPERLRATVLPRLEAAASRLMRQGLVWKSVLDTYQREVERYGGAEGIVLAEKLAWIDSEAVLDLLDLVFDDEGAEARWRLALLGTDRLLSDIGLDERRKSALLGTMQESFGREFRVDAGFRKQLSNRLRGHRKELERLLDGRFEEETEGRLALGAAVLDRRGEALAPLRRELAAAGERGRLDASLTELASSYVHMFNNRLLRAEARPQELVLYDFLARLAQSRAARARVAAVG